MSGESFELTDFKSCSLLLFLSPGLCMNENSVYCLMLLFMLPPQLDDSLTLPASLMCSSDATL